MAIVSLSRRQLTTFADLANEHLLSDVAAPCVWSSSANDGSVVLSLPVRNRETNEERARLFTVNPAGKVEHIC